MGGGLAALLLATIIGSVVCAVTFLFARRTNSLDYRSFFKHLLVTSNRDAITAGLLAGPLAMLPALLFFISDPGGPRNLRRLLVNGLRAAAFDTHNRSIQ
jgi:hypothetical protein